MKLVLLVVSAIAIFAADSRDHPNKPDNGDLSAHQDQLLSSNKGRKWENETVLRGNADKKMVKTLIKMVKSLDQKLTQANSEIKLEILTIRKHQENLTHINTELKDITAKLDSLKEVNSKLVKTNSEMNTEIHALKNNNSKLTQSNSQINKELQACKNQKGFHKLDIGSSGGIARASSTHSSGNHNPINAFSGSYWHTGDYRVPQSLWIEFPKPINVVVYSFTSRTVSPYTVTDGPSKYIFWASNNSDCTKESAWVILKQDHSGTPFSKSNTPKIGIIGKDNSYRCFGFKVNDVPGRDGNKIVTIGNVHFYTSLV